MLAKDRARRCFRLIDVYGPERDEDVTRQFQTVAAETGLSQIHCDMRRTRKRMRQRVTRKTLEMPAPSGLRLVARGFLKDAGTAATHLSKATRDAEALHHFRVALRRLRSWLRAFKDDLHGTIRREDRRALRAIGVTTNLVHELDMQLKWLNGAATGWRGKRRNDVRRLKRALTVRHREAADALDGVLAEFNRIRENLDGRLSRVRKPARRTARMPPLALAIAKRLGSHSDDVDDALADVKSVEDEITAHEARIAAKRLRYLLETAVPHVKKGPRLLKRIKTLQDDLGALHDAHVVCKQLPKMAEPSDALNALAECADGDARAAFRRVNKHWLDHRFKKVAADVSAFAKRLKRLKE
jgi:CHAD domain-containing protein